MIISYSIQDFRNILGVFHMDELTAIFLHSWETMEVLDEVFSSLHHPFSIFPLPEEVSMTLHRIEDFPESGFDIAGKETPGIAEACSSDHESVKVCIFSELPMFRRRIWDSIIRMHDLHYTIIIAHDITIAHDGDTQMLSEFIDPCEVRLPCEGLLVGATVDGDEIGTSIFESLTEFSQEGVILPAESGLHGDRNTHRLAHLFYDPKCRIPIDHERRSMATFDDLLRGTSHIDIDTCDAIGFDNPCGFREFLRIFSKYLDDEWIFTWIVGEGFSLQVLRVDYPVGRVEF